MHGSFTPGQGVCCSLLWSRVITDEAGIEKGFLCVPALTATSRGRV